MKQKSFKLLLIILVFLFIWILTASKYNYNLVPYFLFESTNQTDSQNYSSEVKDHLENYPVNLCNLNNETNQSFVLFAYMMIRLDSFNQRKFIRETWANRTLFPNLRLAFIVGKSINETLNNMINSESDNYGDIIQGNFKDTYRNLTYKSLVAWNWIINYCSHAKIIIKIDDDLVLNTNYLIKYLNLDNNTANIKSKSFYCNVCYNGSPHRNKESKWYASEKEYNYKLYGLKLYPTFCFGPAYIISTDLISLLYEQSKKIKLFWLEDVFTGLLAKDIPYIVFNHIANKYVSLAKVKNNDAIFIKDAGNNFIKIYDKIK